MAHTTSSTPEPHTRTRPLLRRATSAAARWTDLPTPDSELRGATPAARKAPLPGRIRVFHLVVLLGVLVWGGLPVFRGLASDVVRVRSASQPVLAERPAQASSMVRPRRLEGRRPVTRIAAVRIPGVGEWADRVGVPVSAATPHTRVSSGFGPRVHPVWGGVRTHTGVDFAAPRGAPVASTASGVVVAAGRLGGYGLRVEVRHPRSGLTTRYAHLDRIAPGVLVGRPVRRGALVGFVGATGVVTGPHLHYEVRGPSGAALDPAVLARRYQADWARAFHAYGSRSYGSRVSEGRRVQPAPAP